MKLKPLLIVPDVHRPFHDKTAWNLMLKAARMVKPETIVIIGDYMDFYAVSDHIRDPKRRSKFAEEITDGNDGLDQLDKLGAKRKIYVCGNHEDRFTRYINTHAPELDGITSIKQMLKLDARCWEYVPYKEHTTVGKVYFTHDVGASGRTSVHRALDTFHHSVVTGHSHRLAYIVEGNAVGERRLSAQFGWLGDPLQVDYMSRAKANKDWASGFGLGYRNEKTGVVYFTPVPIVSGTCCINGQLLT